jgi:nicotinate-nucleotide--dimethylbenzimidazole phosphoribosyltransferase
VPADPAQGIAARDRADELVKPAGSLGALEALVERWSAATGAPPPVPLRAAVLIFAADHGVVAQGTSLFGSRVSGQVAAAAVRGETAIGVLARGRADRLIVADIGLIGDTPPGIVRRRVADGTGDLTKGPAMTRDQLDAAVQAGAELASEALADADCLACGEIGIGNTTAAAAVLAGLTGLPPEQVCGRGTGLDMAGLERKRAAIRAALAVNAPDPAEPLEVLCRLGGLELAALLGAMLAAGNARRPVVLDGFAVGVVALVAVRVAPTLRELLVAAHRTAEPAHGVILTELGLEPLLDLRLRLGEGSGAALALSLIENAGRLHREMGTFASAGVDGPVRRRLKDKP